jgi:hypothetical protein
MGDHECKIDLITAIKVAKKIGVDMNNVDMKEFHMGINVEMEHGFRYPAWNVTNDCPYETGKIAMAHLEELPDYYTRLEQMENDGKYYWERKDEEELNKDLSVDENE